MEETTISQLEARLGAYLKTVRAGQTIWQEAPPWTRQPSKEDAIEAAGVAGFKPSKPMDNTDFGLAWRRDADLREAGAA